MQLRTKLFLTCSAIVLLPWAGAWWPIQSMISASFDKMASDNFAGTRQSLHSLQTEQIDRMREPGKMVMNIPELRALIAENNTEVSADNLASLQDRLDALASIVGSQFICVLDNRGALIAQNTASPWGSLEGLRRYIAGSAQAMPLVQRLFGASKDGGEQYGLWLFGGHLYQVVGLPLLFSSDTADAHPDGALIMASPVTPQLASLLGRSHGCEISFLSPDAVLASSLPAAFQNLVFNLYAHHQLIQSAPVDVAMGEVHYSSYLEPLQDPCSKTSIGAMLIQSSRADAAAMLSKVSLSLLVIMSTGLLAAAGISFLVSGAITKPVRQLVGAVRRVALGDMQSSIQSNRRDEIGQLATAFNEMVIQLRTRQELQRLVDESQAATKAKSRFLANMSHEIRTPLNGVIGVANLLLSTQLDDRQRHYAELVRSSTEVLTTLINDILDFSKIETGRMELESTDFNLRTVVEGAVELLALKAREKGLRTLARINADVPRWVKGDPNRLRQILMNLLGNAVKFTDKGEINVDVTVAGVDATVIRFAISDTGPGIPPDRMQRLFKSFSQVDASTTRRYGGTGLGLAISKQLAELMGGSIGVDSEPDRGSTFWFTCQFQPAIDPQEPRQGDTAGQHDAVRRFTQPLRILLAEDNQINQMVASDLLANAGCKVDVVSDGRSALETWQKGEYELVLMDCQMPVMDGLQATREIRRLEAAEARRRVPIIALTANASGADRRRCQETGMDGYCSKPFRPQELLELISQNTGTPLQSLDNHPADSRATVDRGDDPPLNLSTLLISCTQNPALAIKILEKFARQIVDAESQLQGMIEAGNGGQIASLSHALKGTAGIVGAERLRGLVSELETLGRAAQLESADKQLQALRLEVQRCTAYIPRAVAELAKEAGAVKGSS